MEKLEKVLLVILGLVIAVGLILALLPTPDNTGNNKSDVKRFSSLEDINNYINLKREEYNKIQESRRSLFPGILGAGPVFQKASSIATSDSGSVAREYSTTNIQVKGVDEADIVKNDG